MNTYASDVSPSHDDGTRWWVVALMKVGKNLREGEAMTAPVRLQLSRHKGFDLQAYSRAVNGLPAVNVARPSLCGNPFKSKDAIAAGYRDGNNMAAWAFGEWMRGSNKDFADYDQGRRSIIINLLPELRGKNLACFCKLGEHCHADVLLELANEGEP